MTDDRDQRVTAAEPVAHGGDGAPAPGEGQPHGTSPREDVARENQIDDATAGDGVAFFEGGDGREDARADIEREG